MLNIQTIRRAEDKQSQIPRGLWPAAKTESVCINCTY